MPVVYRAARADELQATQEHIVRSINELSERHGFGPMASVRASASKAPASRTRRRTSPR
jgi:hypothetical protein